MSRRRKVERPEDFAKGQAEAFESLRSKSESDRDQAVAEPAAKAAIQVSRGAIEHKAAYIEGSASLGRRRLGVPTIEERYDYLWAYAPHRDALSRVRVRAQVIEAVMRVPYVSAKTDSSMMGRTYAFGMWMDETRGSFDWRRDLTQENIRAFAAATLSEHGPGTVNTYRSTLSRVQRGGEIITPLGGKTRARSAHTEAEWRNLNATAAVAGPYADDLRTHLALSGGAGLRYDEIPWAHASWVHQSEDGTFIRVPNKKGEFREVPLLGTYAVTIRDAAARNEGTYLVLPHLRARRNVLAYLKQRVRGMHPVIADYDASRARHYWITRMLAAAVPAVLIAEIADIGPGGSLLSDLLSDMPRPDLRQAFNDLSAASLSD